MNLSQSSKKGENWDHILKYEKEIRCKSLV